MRCGVGARSGYRNVINTTSTANDTRFQPRRIAASRYFFHKRVHQRCHGGTMRTSVQASEETTCSFSSNHIVNEPCRLVHVKLVWGGSRIASRAPRTTALPPSPLPVESIRRVLVI